RVQLDREIVFDQCLIELACCLEATPGVEVIGRRTYLGLPETQPDAPIVGMLAQEVGVLGNRDVVLLPLRGGFRTMHRAGARASPRKKRQDDCSQESVSANARLNQ